MTGFKDPDTEMSADQTEFIKQATTTGSKTRGMTDSQVCLCFAALNCQSFVLGKNSSGTGMASGF